MPRELFIFTLVLLDKTQISISGFSAQVTVKDGDFTREAKNETPLTTKDVTNWFIVYDKTSAVAVDTFLQVNHQTPPIINLYLRMEQVHRNFAVCVLKIFYFIQVDCFFLQKLPIVNSFNTAVRKK